MTSKEAQKIKNWEEINVELTTPAYLRKIADETNRKKKLMFWETVDQCVKDNVDAINDLLVTMAKKGGYEMNSPINICDRKYTDKIGEFDIDEFANAVIKNLQSIYVEKGFKVPDSQSNFFKLGW